MVSAARHVVNEAWMRVGYQFWSRVPAWLCRLLLGSSSLGRAGLDREATFLTWALL